jgi:lysophospholipase L1-like esterase
MVLGAALETQGFGVVEVEIVARTGWTVGELDQAMGVAALTGTYDLVTLQIGVNDQFRGASLSAFSDDYRVLLDRAIGLAGGSPSRVLAVSIPDWGVTPAAAGFDRDLISAEIDAFNAVVRAISSDAGVVLVDVTGVSRTMRQDLVGDGLHPSAEQYLVWVQQILPAARLAVGS